MAKETTPEAANKVVDVQDFDDDEIARWEAEEAEEAKREAECEAAYQQKKQIDKDEAARKEAEAFKMADEDLKRAEREAEEAEEARMRRRLSIPKKDKSVEDADIPAKILGVETLAAEDTLEDSGGATLANDVPWMPPSERKSIRASTSSSKTLKKKPSIDYDKPLFGDEYKRDGHNDPRYFKGSSPVGKSSK